MVPLDVVGLAHELRICPSTAAALQELDLETTSITRVVDLISTDPVLASRLLGVANGAAYGHQAVASLERAVQRLGLEATLSLAWALSLHGVAADHPLGAELRQHAMEVATAARSLAEHTEAASPADAFVMGLLHDIGAQILLVARPEVYGELLGRLGIDDPRLPMSERQTFGLDHAHAAMLCLDAWQLPVRLAHAVGMHHDVRTVRGSRGDRTYALACVLAMAEHFVALRSSGFPSESVRAALVRDPVNRTLQLPEAALDYAVLTFEHDLEHLEWVLRPQSVRRVRRRA